MNDKIIKAAEEIISRKKYWMPNWYCYTKLHYFKSWEEFIDTVENLKEKYPDYIFHYGVWFAFPWQKSGYCCLRIIDRYHDQSIYEYPAI